jgi:hypothetical protein
MGRGGVTDQEGDPVMPETREVLHRPGIAYPRREGGRYVMQMRCTCGETGPDRDDYALAEHDTEAHIADVTPPADQLCRAPRAHRTKKPWDPCPVCADQTALFAL